MDNINLFNLPDDIMLKIFNLSADPAQLSSISKRFQEVFNEEFASNLFNDYRHQPHLKDLANKVNQDPQNANAIQKVRALYTNLIGSTKEIEKGEEIRKESFQHYHNAIDPQRLNELAEKLKEQTARMENIFFSKLLDAIPGFQLFTEEELHAQDEIFSTNSGAKELFQAEKYREWINAHPDVVENIRDKTIEDVDSLIIPKEIEKFVGLITLSIIGAKIKIIPSEIGKLENLMELNLANNSIKSIPPEMGQLKNLRALNLFNNQIENIPLEFSNLKELGQWDIRKNPLSNESIQLLEDMHLGVVFLEQETWRSEEEN